MTRSARPPAASRCYRRDQGCFMVAAMLLLFLDHGVTTVHAFMPDSVAPIHKHGRLGRSSKLMSAGSDDDSGGSSNKKVERARKMLLEAWESDDDDTNENHHLSAKILIRMITESDDNNITYLLPPPPPLTTAERDRRMVELKLLEQLASSDEVTHELMDFWEWEKGSDAQERLVHAADMLEAGQVIAAENMLIKLIDDYGAYWVEPMNRLATVLFRQGRLEESYRLCVSVLQMKPWHFGALDGIVTVSMAMCDRDKARKWAERGLPKLIASTSFPPFATTGPANPKRAHWVHEAIQQAQEALSHLEYQTKRDFLGTPEEYYNHAEKKAKEQQQETNMEAETKKPSVFTDDSPGDYEDAWQ